MNTFLTSLILLSSALNQLQVSLNESIEIKTAEAQVPVIVQVDKRSTTGIVEPSSPISNESKALALVKKYSQEYKVSAIDMEKVMRCENRTFDPTLQSYHKKKDGTRERSYGVAQWNLDFNDITYAQATDMEWSIKEMAKAFSKRKQNLWSCWRIVYPPQKG